MALTTKTYAWGAVALALIGVGGMYALPLIGRGTDPFASCRTTAVAGGAAAIGGHFTLTDEDGRTVTDRDVMAKPALVYFGYTFCPDICPTDVARNAAAVDILEEMGQDVTPVFISVDPRRDTPAVLKEWTEAIHPRLIGLTGTPDQIKAAATAYKTIYNVPENPPDDYYTVDHMTYTYLMLPGSRFAEFFTSQDSSDDVAKRAACFIGNAPAA